MNTAPVDVQLDPDLYKQQVPAASTTMPATQQHAHAPAKSWIVHLIDASMTGKSHAVTKVQKAFLHTPSL
jgi:hypothetical protein